MEAEASNVRELSRRTSSRGRKGHNRSSSRRRSSSRGDEQEGDRPRRGGSKRRRSRRSSSRDNELGDAEVGGNEPTAVSSMVVDDDVAPAISPASGNTSAVQGLVVMSGDDDESTVNDSKKGKRSRTTIYCFIFNLLLVFGGVGMALHFRRKQSSNA